MKLSPAKAVDKIKNEIIIIPVSKQMQNFLTLNSPLYICVRHIGNTGDIVLEADSWIKCDVKRIEACLIIDIPDLTNWTKRYFISRILTYREMFVTVTKKHCVRRYSCPTGRTFLEGDCLNSLKILIDFSVLVADNFCLERAVLTG